MKLLANIEDDELSRGEGSVSQGNGTSKTTVGKKPRNSADIARLGRHLPVSDGSVDRIT